MVLSMQAHSIKLYTFYYAREHHLKIWFTYLQYTIVNDHKLLTNTWMNLQIPMCHGKLFVFRGSWHIILKIAFADRRSFHVRIVLLLPSVRKV